jgi:hypothetical protein
VLVGLFQLSIDTGDLVVSLPVRGPLGVDWAGRPTVLLEQRRRDRWEPCGLVAWRPSSRSVRCEFRPLGARPGELTGTYPAPQVAAVLRDAPHNDHALMAALIGASEALFGTRHLAKAERSCLLPLLLDGLESTTESQLWEPPRTDTRRARRAALPGLTPGLARRRSQVPQ